MTDRRTRSALFFDSGIGGLSVLREARVLMPDWRFVYVADDAAFPYGAWEEDALREHITDLFSVLLEDYRPALSVIACNTASTLAIRTDAPTDAGRVASERIGGARFRVVDGTAHLMTGDLELAVREELLTLLDELDRPV